MKGRKTTGTERTKIRALLGLVLIIGVVLGLSFWRSERVDARDTDRPTPNAYVP
ncbi:MAG: hypothetical protein IPN69_18235 [Acidobacteria bacterium]|nr:hypothetical protein [Acidobacteriota bacterium]